MSALLHTNNDDDDYQLSDSRLLVNFEENSDEDDDNNNFNFDENDVIIFGQESSGVPDYVASKAINKITIPMKNNARSLNLAISCAIILAAASH